MFKYIADKDHYTEVLSLCEKVEHDLRIAEVSIGFKSALFVILMWIKQVWKTCKTNTNYAIIT